MTDNYFSPELDRYLTTLEAQHENEKLKRIQAENTLGELSGFPQQKEQNLIEYQLSLKEELDRIYHLLSGHIIKIKNGNEVWDEPDDDRLKIFSDYGVKLIMNIIQFYLNRDTLLSNYDEETITWKVRDFAIELSDLIFNKYELFFYYPSPEELYELYLPYAKKKGFNITEGELYERCIRWSNEELQSKIRHYPIIVTAIIDLVHSTYLRALNGEERESLRRQTHISNNISPLSQMNIQPRSTGLFGLGGKK